MPAQELGHAATMRVCPSWGLLCQNTSLTPCSKNMKCHELFLPGIWYTMLSIKLLNPSCSNTLHIRGISYRTYSCNSLILRWGFFPHIFTSLKLRCILQLMESHHCNIFFFLLVSEKWERILQPTAPYIGWNLVCRLFLIRPLLLYFNSYFSDKIVLISCTRMEAPGGQGFLSDLLSSSLFYLQCLEQRLYLVCLQLRAAG